MTNGNRIVFERTGDFYRPVITAIPATNNIEPITTCLVIFSSPRKNIAVKAMMNSGVVLMIGLTTETSPACKRDES